MNCEPSLSDSDAQERADSDAQQQLVAGEAIIALDGLFVGSPGRGAIDEGCQYAIPW